MSESSFIASAVVAENLADAASAEGLEKQAIRGKDGLEGHIAGTGAEGGAEHVVSPMALGMDSTGWVAVAALVVIAIAIIKKVPAMIGKALDGRIAAIRVQLDEATRLRAEAEALRAEYEGKARAAEADAATMREHAHHEAQAILVKAKQDAEELMTRRTKMAEDKIAGAERAAIAEVRVRAADAAQRAAATLIAEQHGADSDRAMVDRTIVGLGRLN